MRQAVPAAIAVLMLAPVIAEAAPQATAPLQSLVRTANEPLLIEGVARAASGALVLSSIQRGRLFRAGADEALEPFGPDGGQGLFGIATDPARGLLWVASSPTPIDDQEDRPAELLKIDATTGALLASFAADGLEHAFGDVAVGPDGAVFVADGKGRAILVLRVGAARLETLVRLPERGSPQGMAVSPDGRTLIFANYGTGLHRIDLSEGYQRRDFTAETLTPLPGPEGAELRGIDGLARNGDTIIAVQNGTRTHRVLRLTLNADWTAVVDRAPLAEGPPLEEPTTGFVEDDAFIFVSRSQWTDFEQDGRPKSQTPEPAVVSRLPL